MVDCSSVITVQSLPHLHHLHVDEFAGVPRQEVHVKVLVVGAHHEYLGNAIRDHVSYGDTGFGYS